jgi:hypothetical protein
VVFFGGLFRFYTFLLGDHSISLDHTRLGTTTTTILPSFDATEMQFLVWSSSTSSGWSIMVSSIP